MRPIQATVSFKALQHNFAVVKKYAPNAKVMAVLKANAYGHGLLDVAHALNEAEGFAVLRMREAIDLHEAGFEQKIVLLQGAFSANALAIASSFRFDVVVHSEHQIQMLELDTLRHPVNVHLKMNSGMNRLGFKPKDYQAAYERLKACQNVADIVLMTHFANADADLTHYQDAVSAPLQRFKEATKGLTEEKSLANSASILLHPETQADWVRPGIMLYGATPVSGTPPSEFDLQPVMQLNAEIMAIQTIETGESVGYGNRFTASKKTIVGVVACGYADGYPRHAPNGTPIAVNGHLTHTIGRVSMDMLFCDLTDIPEVYVGASVELWGKQVPIDTVAGASNTVGYELLCALAPRVPVKVVD